MSLVQYGQDIDRIELASTTQEMGAARLAGQYLLYALEDTRRSLDRLAAAASVDSRAVTVSDLAAAAHAGPAIAAISVTDSTGRLLASTVGRRGQLIDALDAFDQARKARHLIYSDYFESSLMGRPAVSMVMPYFAPSGRFAGVVSADLNLNFLLGFTGQYPFTDHYYIFFVDRRGTILAAQNFQPGRNIGNNPPVRALLAGKDGTMKYQSTFFGDRVDGQERLGAFRHIGDSGWGVVISQPSARVLASPIQNLRNFLLVMGLAGLGSLLIALAVARRLTEPLARMEAEMALRTSRQDFHAGSTLSIASGVREFEFLATAYNTLMDQIRQNFAQIEAQRAEINAANVSLEAQVAQRTRELQEAYRTLADKAQELEGANDKLTEVVKELRKLDQLQADFLANVSHELRTPITFITAYGSSLADGLLGPLDARQREAVGSILEGADRLIALVEDLLDLNRLESGTLEVVPTSLEAAPIMTDLLNEMKPLAHARNQEIGVEIEAGVPALFADGIRVQQVLRNLVSNAIKFTPEKGAIRIRCRADLEGVAIEVVDNGIGIPEDALPHLFDRFYQVDTSSTRTYGGTGIGLNIVRDLLSLMGGRVEVESEPGKGSRFRCVFPASKEPSRSVEQTWTAFPLGAARVEPEAPVPMKHPHILEDGEQPPPPCVPEDEELVG